MQAPSAHQVTHARLQRCTFALQNGFARLQADLEPLTRQAKQLAKQAAKEEQRPQALQQEQRQQPHDQRGQGPGEKAAAAADGDGAGAAAAGPRPAPLQPHGQARRADGAPTAASAPYTWQVYGSTVDLESPSLGTLRAPLAAPLPEVMAAAAPPAATGPGGGGGVPVRRHLTDADRARWNKLDRILSHQFSSLQRIKYTALTPEYLQRLHQQMYGPPPAPAAAPPPATPAAGAADAAAAK